jgi:enamine deaminase RidA (YjgF/YER057c/UK114 family)
MKFSEHSWCSNSNNMKPAGQGGGEKLGSDPECNHGAIMVQSWCNHGAIMAKIKAAMACVLKCGQFLVDRQTIQIINRANKERFRILS